MNNAKFQCPHCHQAFASPARVIGMVVRCRSCGMEFQAGAVQQPPRAGPQFHSAKQRNASGGTGPPPRDSEEAAVFWVIAVGGMLASVFMGYFGLYKPLAQMHQHVPQVSCSAKALVIFPSLAISSIALTVFAVVKSRRGKSAPPVHSARTHPGNILSKREKFQILLGVAVALAPGIWLFVWFNDQVQKLGYKNGSLTVPRKPVSLRDPVPDFYREYDRFMTRKFDQDIPRKLETPDRKQQEFWKNFEKQLKEKPAKTP